MHCKVSENWFIPCSLRIVCLLVITDFFFFYPLTYINNHVSIDVYDSSGIRYTIGPVV
jgi:hypothetical protein